MPFRVGFGYDVHKLVKGRRLILGGVSIDYEYGLYGHSDADCLTHAICDALLGALNLGDIGEMFPDTDEKYKNINSMIFLEHIKDIILKRGFYISNIDSTIVMQKPKLVNYKEQMKKNIALSLGIDAERVSVKATTTETLGFEGRGLGVSVYSVASLVKI